jgi:hypothetical protein
MIENGLAMVDLSSISLVEHRVEGWYVLGIGYLLCDPSCQYDMLHYQRSFLRNVPLSARGVASCVNASVGVSCERNVVGLERIIRLAVV